MKNNVSVVDSVLGWTRIDLGTLQHVAQVQIIKSVICKVSSVMRAPEFELSSISGHFDGHQDLVELRKGIERNHLFMAIYENENSHKLHDDLRGFHVERRLLLSHNGRLTFAELTHKELPGGNFRDLKKIVIRWATDKDLVEYIIRRGLAGDLLIRLNSILYDALEMIDDRREEISSVKHFLKGVGVRSKVSGF